MIKIEFKHSEMAAQLLWHVVMYFAVTESQNVKDKELDFIQPSR